MKSAITTSLETSWIQYLDEESKRQKLNRNNIIEKALSLYKSVELAQKIKEGLEDRQEEYRSFAKDFQVAQTIILRQDK